MDKKKNNKPYLIGITGGSGSGKTFFLNCFLHHFKNNEVTLVSQDDYYIPQEEMTPEENKLHNFDLPAAIDDKQFLYDINKLVKGDVIYKKEYNFNNPLATGKILQINPAPIVIVEGLFILHFKEIAAMLDFRIFIEADEKVALQRRINRDGAIRGYSKKDVLYKWHHHVAPAYKTFLLPHKNDCDQFILNNLNAADDLIKITEKIASGLKVRHFDF